MARRRSRSKTPRKPRSKTINAAGVVEATMIANAVTQGFFNVGIGQFVMNTNSMTGSQITARELISGLTGGSYGTMSSIKLPKVGGGYQTLTSGMTFGDQIKENLSNNGGKMVMSLVLIPAGFKAFKKLTSKPRSLTNQALKMSGLPVRV